jgi:hypothetical protein
MQAWRSLGTVVSVSDARLAPAKESKRDGHGLIGS